MILKTCITCNDSFEVRNYRRDTAKFCGKRCQGVKLGLSRKGCKLTESQIRASLNSRFKKGSTPWNKELKGIHLSPETEWKKGYTPQGSVTFTKGSTPWNKGKEIFQIQGEKHHLWKGDAVGYSALHKWVYRNLGKPIRCANCNLEKKKYHWANLSGKYLRLVSDWVELCVSCHKNFDLGNMEIKTGGASVGR